MANGLFGGGNGTQGNPYIVEDVADILAINSHNNSASNVLYYSQN
jgi:hypothetical protein